MLLLATILYPLRNLRLQGEKGGSGRKSKRPYTYLKIPGFENLLLQTTTRRESGQLT